MILDCGEQLYCLSMFTLAPGQRNQPSQAVSAAKGQYPFQFQDKPEILLKMPARFCILPAQEEESTQKLQRHRKSANIAYLAEQRETLLKECQSACTAVI